MGYNKILFYFRLWGYGGYGHHKYQFNAAFLRPGERFFIGRSRLLSGERCQEEGRESKDRAFWLRAKGEMSCSEK